jgi:hypothetical protein
MPARHVIVDGSNLATEGRSLPSLSQLDQAVREFLAENPDDVVTVVVDASFGHRIDPSEVPMFEEAEEAGEVVSPPAGAIGRGDAFLLRIAEKTGATVLSNDSFQEFHGEHVWLFDTGRLIGGKPVPGVGWIFMPRTPVRGQKSREVVKEAKRKKHAEDGSDATAGTGTAAATGLDLAASRSKGRAKKVDRAIARATEEAVEPKSDGGRRRRTGGLPPADPVNEPLAFITFIAAHPLGSEVVGTVAEFSSHGAFVDADGARCYLPLSAMGEPPPRRAREVVGKGEERSFVVQALDPQRRGVELALPGFARVAGGPTEETVEAEIHPKAVAPKRRRGEKAAAPVVETAVAGAGGRKPERVKAAAAKVAGGRKAPAKEGAGAEGGQAKRPEAATKKSGGATKKPAATGKATAAAGKVTAAGGKATAAAERAGPAQKKAAAAAKKTAAPGRKRAAPAEKVPASVDEGAPPVRKTRGGVKPAEPSTGKAATPVKRAGVKKAAVKKAAVKESSAPSKKTTATVKKAEPAAKRVAAARSRRP